MHRLPREPRKKALCIGIEYVEFSSRHPVFEPLPGAYKDALSVKQLLQDVYGYKAEDIKVMTDDVVAALDISLVPTKDNMIAAMHELIRDAHAGDRLVFHYSGHGSQIVATPDHTEETDGYDEVLWPADIQYSDGTEAVENYIIDNDVRNILVNKLPEGVHLVIILDNCRSGTGADLDYTEGAVSVMVDSPIERKSTRKVLNMPESIHGVVEDSRVIIKSKYNSKDDRQLYVTSWSACRDNQDTKEDDSGGVFVKAFTDVLTEERRLTHKQLLKRISERIIAIYNKGEGVLKDAEPQLGSIRKIELIQNELFEM